MRLILSRLLIGILYCLAVLAFFEASARVGLSSDWLFTRITSGKDNASNRLAYVHGWRPNHLQHIDIYHPVRG